MSEPTEEPSPRKLKKARERGEAPQSSLATFVIVLAGVSAVLSMSAGSMIASWRALAVACWTPIDPEVAMALAVDHLAGALVWPLAIVVALGALGSFLQVGPIFSAAPIAPDVRRLWRPPWSIEAIGPRLAALVPAVAILVIGAWVLKSALPGVLGRTDLDAARALAIAITVIEAFVWRALVVLIACAAIAIFYARWRFYRGQRMTRREVDQERKETEGEPEARRRRAQIHRARALAPPLDEAFEGAALLVCAPGSAMVLRWRSGSSEAAAVSLAAHGTLALEARSLARQRGVPIVHDALLSRELERTLDGAPLARATLIRLAHHLAREAA
jgi:flagellar biosynthesis protein FlhB